MIFAQKELRAAVKQGKIGFDPPLDEDQWGEASVDLRLGFQFTTLPTDLRGVRFSVADGLKTIGKYGLWTERTLKEPDGFGKRETFPLEPGEFVLAFTYEKVRVPSDMIAMVEGRSSYARMGLSVHQTAPWIQPGWSGRILLEIYNSGPFSLDLIPMIDRPCQLAFIKLSSRLPGKLAYGSKAKDVFQDQQHALP